MNVKHGQLHYDFTGDRCVVTVNGCKWMCQHSRSGCENKWFRVWRGQNNEV